MFRVPVMDCGDGLVRAQIACRKPHVAKTAAYTILGSESGTCFTNAGASGSVTFTLPAPKTGMMFKFLKAVNNQTIVITAPTAGTMNYLTQGVTITDSTTEYATVELETDGTSWFVNGVTGTWSVT